MTHEPSHLEQVAAREAARRAQEKAQAKAFRLASKEIRKRKQMSLANARRYWELRESGRCVRCKRSAGGDAATCPKCLGKDQPSHHFSRDETGRARLCMRLSCDQQRDGLSNYCAEHRRKRGKSK